MYMATWAAISQLFFTILFSFPAVTIQPLSTWSDWPKNIHNGARCFLGTDTVLCNILDTRTGLVLISADVCRLGATYGLTYIALNLVANILGNFMLKFGTANMVFLAVTATVPTTSMLKTRLGKLDPNVAFETVRFALIRYLLTS